MNFLQQKLERVLNDLLQLLDPLATNSTVNDLVVEAASHDDLVIPLSHGTLFGLNGNGNLASSADGQDTSLRGVDDSSEALNSGVHAHVRDGEGTALVLLGLQLVLAGTLAKILDLVGDAGQAETLNVLDDGGDQAGGSSHGNTDVSGAVLANDGLPVLLTPAGVDLGDLKQSHCAGLDQEIIDGELVLAVGRGVESLAQLKQLSDGQGGRDKVVGVVSHGLLQAVCNGLAHGRNLDVLVGRASRSGGTSGLVLLNVLLGNHTATASTLQSLDGNTLLESESLGGRADRGLTVQAGLQLVAGSLRFIGGGLFGGGSRGLGLSALGFLLLRLRGGLVTAGIGQSERLERRDIGTLLNENSDGLSDEEKKTCLAVFLHKRLVAEDSEKSFRGE